MPTPHCICAYSTDKRIAVVGCYDLSGRVKSTSSQKQFQFFSFLQYFLFFFDIVFLLPANHE